MAACPPTLKRRTAALRVNGDYREFLENRGLTTHAGFLALTGIIVCGHPDRHVLRVTLGSGEETLTAFLKREHRVPWRGRLANAWAGFGWVSQSCREAEVLRQLNRAGVPCPEWLAAGEDRDGRAFLLVRELTGAVDLRLFLNGQSDPARRRRLARKLGETLAHMHDAGFDHPDLYSKHILVNPRDLTVHVLDWQRSRRRADLDWPRRWRDLAALHATLDDALANPRERLACLRAYLRATVPGRVPRAFRLRVVNQVRRRAQRLLRRRHIGEQRNLPLGDGGQRLIWLDGEALCVTPELHAALSSTPAHALTGPSGDREAPNPATVSGQSQAMLVRRQARWTVRWFWDWLRGKHLMSSELRQAGLLFRLQRYGIGTPRLLAFGQKHFPPRRTESFLLTEAPPGSVAFAEWLANQPGDGLWTAEQKQRRRLIRQAGAVVRRMHEARCYLAGNSAGVPLQVQVRRQQTPTVVVGSVDGLRTQRKPRPRDVIADLGHLLRHLPRSSYTRTDALRLLLAYLGERRLSTSARRLATTVVRAQRPAFFTRLARWLALTPCLLASLSPSLPISLSSFSGVAG